VIVTYFSTGVDEFIHCLMLKTWVHKTERMSVQRQFVQSDCMHKDKFTEKAT